LPGATGFVFNLKREQLQDIRVRQALGLVYNFSWTNDTLQYGLFKQRESFWQNSDLAAKGKPEGKELEYLNTVKDLVDPAIFTEDVTMPHVSGGDRQLDRNNLRTASALLDDAGWPIGDDGLRHKDGKTLKVEFLSVSASFDRILNPYVENLKQLGVDATYNRVDDAQYSERTQQTFDYDMIFDGYSNGLEEGTGFSQRYGSDGVGDVFNPAQYSSPAIDKLSDAIVKAKTYEDMAAAVRAADRIMRHDYFIVPIWYLGNYWLAYYDMFEHPAELPAYGLGHLDWWWFNAQKAEALVAAGALR
jgi:microcin C transport system substrate-binding protein